MQIDRETFREGQKRDSIEQKIIDYLHANSAQAFNIQEITDGVIDPGGTEMKIAESKETTLPGDLIDRATVRSIVDSLADNGTLERRLVDSGERKRSYFAAPDGIPSDEG